MKYLIVSIFLLVSAANSAQAKDRVGNGGNAIFRGGKAYLLDLVVAGVENDTISGCDPASVGGAYLDNRFVPEDQELFARVAACLPSVDQMAMQAALELYEFRFVEEPVVSAYDAESPIDVPLVPAAYRRDHLIFVNANVFRSMDSLSRVALVFHELFYSFIEPRAGADGFFGQSSWEAMSITGDFFAHVSKSYFRKDGTFFDRYQRDGVHQLAYRNGISSEFPTRHLGFLTYSRAGYMVAPDKTVSLGFGPGIAVYYDKERAHDDEQFMQVDSERTFDPTSERPRELCEKMKKIRSSFEIRAQVFDVEFFLRDISVFGGMAKVATAKAMRRPLRDYTAGFLNQKPRKFRLIARIKNGESESSCRRKAAAALNEIYEGLRVYLKENGTFWQ